MVTQKELRRILHYSPDTGIFTRLVSKGGRKVGESAGHFRYDGYSQIKIEGYMYLSHRLAWLYMMGEFPEEIDHINHVRNDNRWINLREASSQENAQNQSMRNTNKSGFTGVSWHKASNKWQADICVGYKGKYLGVFKELSDPVKARLDAENNYEFHENHGT